jgi:hypothetical protein
MRGQFSSELAMLVRRCPGFNRGVTRTVNALSTSLRGVHELVIAVVDAVGGVSCSIMSYSQTCMPRRW